MEDFLRVGVITSSHGLKGEVKVFPTTDDSSRFQSLKQAFLDHGKEKLPVEIQSVRYSKNMVLVKFKGYDDINQVEGLKGTDILVDRAHAVKLEPNENFITDLIGLSVVTDAGEDFGTVADILKTGANDVYVVDSKAHGEVLLPSIPQCILDVDLTKRQVVVHIMEGLLD